jgi:hypothetical protein
MVDRVIKVEKATYAVKGCVELPRYGLGRIGYKKFRAAQLLGIR